MVVDHPSCWVVFIEGAWTAPTQENLTAELFKGVTQVTPAVCGAGCVAGG